MIGSGTIGHFIIFNKTQRAKLELLNIVKELTYYFPCRSLKRFTFRVILSDSIFFLLGQSPIVN